MKPLKSLYPFALWVLRLAVIILVYLLFSKTAFAFDYRHLPFFVALVFIAGAVLLFIGGFSNKHTLTIIASFLLFIASAYHLIITFSTRPDVHFASVFLLLGVALFFITAGNKK